MHRKRKWIHKYPSQRKIALFTPVIPLSLSRPHQTSLQILLTKLSKSTSNLTILAASISNSNHHLLYVVSWLVSWLPFWFHSPFPHRSQNEQTFKKSISSCHFLFSPSSDFLLYWQQHPKPSSWSISTYKSDHGPHLIWLSIAFLLLYHVPTLQTFLLLL